SAKTGRGNSRPSVISRRSLWRSSVHGSRTAFTCSSPCSGWFPIGASNASWRLGARTDLSSSFSSSECGLAICYWLSPIRGAQPKSTKHNHAPQPPIRNPQSAIRNHRKACSAQPQGISLPSRLGLVSLHEERIEQHESKRNNDYEKAAAHSSQFGHALGRQ